MTSVECAYSTRPARTQNPHLVVNTTSQNFTPVQVDILRQEGVPADIINSFEPTPENPFVIRDSKMKGLETPFSDMDLARSRAERRAAQTPEYATFEFGLISPYFVGGHVHVTLDGYGNWYWGLNVDVGLPGLVLSGMLGWQLSGRNRTEEELESSLHGWGGSVSGGAVLGGGAAWSNYPFDGSGRPGSFLGGLTFPGISISEGYSWFLFPSQKDYE